MSSDKELLEAESRCEATRAARQNLEADNEKMDLELMDAKAQLAKISEGKDGFETTLAQSEVQIEAKRLAMKDGEKMFNREKEDFRKDMENMKQMLKDQMKAMMKENEAEERKMKEALDDLGVMEFGATSLAQDIVNMHRRIDLQKDQLKMTQKFVEKLEKEKKDIEVMYDKLRRDHDAVRSENSAKEMENLELQLQLNPEARAQYQAEAAMREDSRPKPKKKKKQQQKDSEFDVDSEYEGSSRGGGSRQEGSDDRPASRRKGGASKVSAYDDEEPAPRRRGGASKMSAYDDEEPAPRRKGGASKMSAYEDEEESSTMRRNTTMTKTTMTTTRTRTMAYDEEESSPQPVRKSSREGADRHREKEMSVLNARARRERDH